MDSQTIETYNHYATEYDNDTVEFWENFPMDFLQEFTSRVPSSILNIGSGPGRDGILLQDTGKDVTCLDASQTMVNLCVSRGLLAVQGDFLSLPFENNSFDGVWAYTSLLHVPKSELGLALQEVRRVLKSDGVFALGMIEGNAELHRETSGMRHPRWFSYYSDEELRGALNRHGFSTLFTSTYTPSSRRYLHYVAVRSETWE